MMTHIYIEYFEEMALETAPLKPTIWLRYIGDTFILWPHQKAVQILMDHVNLISPSIPVHNGRKPKSSFSGCTNNL